MIDLIILVQKIFAMMVDWEDDPEWSKQDEIDDEDEEKWEIMKKSLIFS